MTDHLQKVEQLLTQRIGLDPRSVGPASIARAVHRQMADGGCENVQVYYRRLLESEADLGRLIDEVIVPESWFFRDDRPFRWLEDHVRRCWLTDPSRLPLRVLSLACSGGEEPYSIAISLLDLGLPARRFRIDAVDVSARRLEVARRGLYSANAFRGRPGGRTPERWRKHFREHEAGFELDPAVRATVHCSQASILDPRLLEGSSPYDVIFCRNLLIYFDSESRTAALSAIEQRLAPDGFLIIGHADRLDPYHETPRFVPEADSASFVYRRARPSPAAATVANPIPPPTHPKAAVSRSSASTVDHSDTIDVWLPPSPPVASIPIDLPSTLEEAARLANQGLFEAAINQCELQIQRKGPTAAGYYLMGMIRQAMGDRAQAEQCFQKTAYLEPSHADALLALALLAERRGDQVVAAAYHRRAERAAAARTSSKR